MANRHQLAKLEEGVGAWIEWIEQHPNIRINRKKAKLQNANLSNADLRDADFSNADLSGVDFRNADVSGASFLDANLNNADLSGVARLSTTFRRGSNRLDGAFAVSLVSGSHAL
jgi:hypothetical protein